MKKLLLVLVLLLGCNNTTGLDGNVSGVYCLEQFYYNFKYLPTGNSFTLEDEMKKPEASVCIDIRQYSDSSGFYHLEGGYELLWRSQTGDTLTFKVIPNNTVEESLYEVQDNVLYLNSSITWIYRTKHFYRNDVLQGHFGYHSAQIAETLAVGWRRR